MSDTATVTFAGEIRRLAAAQGRVPTDAQVADLEALTRSRSFVDATAGTVVMNDGSAVAVFLNQEVASFAPAKAELPAGSDLIRVRIGSSTGHRRADDFFASFTAGLDKAHDAALAAEAATWPNPWAKGHENRTRQVVLTKINPAGAAKMKAEASQ